MGKASKWGLRAAADTKRKKHAQRTPLPPRAGEVAAAQEAIAWAAQETTEYPSVAKASEFARYAGGLGWDVAFWSEEDHAKVQAERGDEIVRIEWLKGVFVPGSCAYLVAGDSSAKPRNAAHARRFLETKPEEVLARRQAALAAAAERAKRAEEAAAKPKDEKPQRATRGSARKPAPNFGLLTDYEALAALVGKHVTWINRITELEETDVVRAGVGRLSSGITAPRIEEGPDGRVLKFLGAHGFRCLLLSQVVRVGR